MGFLKSLIPRNRIFTPWGGPGKRKEHQDPQSGTSKRPHRGLALEDRAKPNETPENQAHWTNLPEHWAREFVYYNQELHVHSSNVAFAQYWRESQEMYVHFLSGYGGTYSNVTEAEAVDFTMAGSKGGWVIDVLIGRGNLQGHACWTVNGGRSIKPYRPNYRPGSVALIPQDQIRVTGEPDRMIPEDEILAEGKIGPAQEDVFRDRLRRESRLTEESPSLEHLNNQRRAEREFKKRLLNG